LGNPKERKNKRMEIKNMNDIKLYTKHDCPHCVAAKVRLDEMGLEYEEIDVANTPGTRDFLKTQGHKTVPQIYINGKAVPGGNQGLQVMTEQQIRDWS